MENQNADKMYKTITSKDKYLKFSKTYRYMLSGKNADLGFTTGNKSAEILCHSPTMKWAYLHVQQYIANREIE